MKQTIPGVFELRFPEMAAVPVVFDSPHSGNADPPDFDPVAPRARLRRAEDMFVDSLFDTAPEEGAVLLAALLWTQVASSAIFARTAIAEPARGPGVPDAAHQRDTMIQEMREMRAAVDSLRGAVESDGLKVEVTNLDEIRIEEP